MRIFQLWVLRGAILDFSPQGHGVRREEGFYHVGRDVQNKKIRDPNPQRSPRLGGTKAAFSAREAELLVSPDGLDARRA